MGTYVSPYVKCIAGGNLLNDPGSPGSLLCDYMEQWMGREVQGGGITRTPMAASC